MQVWSQELQMAPIPARNDPWMQSQEKAGALPDEAPKIKKKIILGSYK